MIFSIIICLKLKKKHLNKLNLNIRARLLKKTHTVIVLLEIMLIFLMNKIKVQNALFNFEIQLFLCNKYRFKNI